MIEKKILKKIAPLKFLEFYRKVNSSDFKIKMLEGQIKNQWLIQNRGEIKDQKEMIRRHEFKIYSQTGEDGIINYIFSKIDTKNKKFVELGIEDGKECNTANLSLNFGWKGMLIEGNKEYATKAKD